MLMKCYSCSMRGVVFFGPNLTVQRNRHVLFSGAFHLQLLRYQDCLNNQHPDGLKLIMIENSQEVKTASAAQFGLRTLVVGAVAIVNCALLLGKRY
jgi:hypothetical protein